MSSSSSNNTEVVGTADEITVSEEVLDTTPAEVTFLGACQRGNAEGAAELLSQVDVNYTDKLGNTGLHYASKGHPAVVQILLDAGADLSIQNSNGDTAIHNACFADAGECADFLIHAGASLDVANNQGKLPKDLVKSGRVGALIQAAELAQQYGDDLDDDMFGGDDDDSD